MTAVVSLIMCARRNKGETVAFFGCIFRLIIFIPALSRFAPSPFFFFFSLPLPGVARRRPIVNTYIISLNRFNGFVLQTPPVGRPSPRHYIIARQACLRRQICVVLLHTEAQGASSAADEPPHHNTNTRRGLCCQDCAPALLLRSGDSHQLASSFLFVFFGGRENET